jgi:peptidoglycan/LPS O-acetylase OafA/YrhL
VQTNRRYWFAAKRYGWGWSLPITWQGWLVFATFILLLAAGALLFPPGHNPTAFLAYTCVLCAVLAGVCYLKGEPLHWRWGKENEPGQ